MELGCNVIYIHIICVFQEFPVGCALQDMGVFYSKVASGACSRSSEWEGKVLLEVHEWYPTLHVAHSYFEIVAIYMARRKAQDSTDSSSGDDPAVE